MHENALATPLDVGDRGPGESDAFGQARLRHPDLVAADGNCGTERFISGVWRHGSMFGLRRGRCQCGKQDVIITNVVKFVLTSFEVCPMILSAGSPPGGPSSDPRWRDPIAPTDLNEDPMPNNDKPDRPDQPGRPDDPGRPDNPGNPGGPGRPDHPEHPDVPPGPPSHTPGRPDGPPTPSHPPSHRPVG